MGVLAFDILIGDFGKDVEGLSKRSTDAELATAAPGIPVFALEPLAATTVAA